MSEVELDLLRAWSPEPVRPSTEVRNHARAQLELQYRAPDPIGTRSTPTGRAFGKRLAIAAVAALVLIAGTVIWAQRQVDDRVARLKTVTVPGGALGGGEVGHGPVNVLVVGSDSRAGSDPARFGSVVETGPPRSDTMILLRIDGRSITALWIPRDLLVTTGSGVQTRINSTFNQGPAGLIAAIKAAFGVSVDHYIEVGFTSFPRVVDALGGVRIHSPGHVRDAFSGLELSGPGCRTLDGTTALAWVRSRHLEVEQGGYWTDASPHADLDRLARQQDFIRALVTKTESEAHGDPVAAVGIADAVLPALVVDSGFSRSEILGFVRALVDVDPAAMQLSTLPVQESSELPGRLVLRQPDADATLAPFKGVSSPPAPASVPSSPPC